MNKSRKKLFGKKSRRIISKSKSSKFNKLKDGKLFNGQEVDDDIPENILLENLHANFIPTRKNILKVPGDGNCLFHALCHELKRVGRIEQINTDDDINFKGVIFNYHNDLRQMICDKLQELYNIVFDDTNALYNHLSQIMTEDEIDEYLPLQKYIDEMREDETWGGDLEISMIPFIFGGIDVQIWTKPRHTRVTQLRLLNPGNGQENGTIRLYNAAGNTSEGTHFDVVSLVEVVEEKSKSKPKEEKKGASPTSSKKRKAEKSKSSPKSKKNKK